MKDFINPGVGGVMVAHNICRKCWDRLHPGQKPILVHPDPVEVCCFCGASAGDGIYTQDEPKTIRCDCDKELTPERLDGWSAKELMGWVLGEEIGKTHIDAFRYYKKGVHSSVMMESDWNPSNPTTGQIWLVVEEMRNLGWEFRLENTKDYMAQFVKITEVKLISRDAIDSNPCLAILKAARMAKEEACGYSED